LPQVLDRLGKILLSHGVCQVSVTCLAKEDEADGSGGKLFVAGQALKDRGGCDFFGYDKWESEVFEKFEHGAGTFIA